MLVITTTVRMLHRVHCHTTDLGPAVTFDLVFVISTASFQQGLVDTTTSGDDSDDCTSFRVQNFLGARWQLDPGFASVWIVRDVYDVC